MKTARLNPHEKAALLRTAGIGYGMVDLIESAGYASILQMKVAGVERVLDDIRFATGNTGVANRRRALQRVLMQFDSMVHSGDPANSHQSGPLAVCPMPPLTTCADGVHREIIRVQDQNQGTDLCHLISSQELG